MRAGRWLCVGMVCWVCSSCFLEPFTGSEVVLEVGTASLAAGDIANRSDEHYALYTVMDESGSLIQVEEFTIDAQLNALSYPEGEAIGVANRPAPTGQPEGGITIRSEANLSRAVGVLLSIERNDDTDPAPDTVVGRGELMPGNRSVLFGVIEGSVPRVGGGESELVNSRVAIILDEA
ncbi:MAG: hypothetical protein AAFS10_17705, partial [Myxococcota bacterium]